jgi:hypothetical protein
MMTEYPHETTDSEVDYMGYHDEGSPFTREQSAESVSSTALIEENMVSQLGILAPLRRFLTQALQGAILTSASTSEYAPHHASRPRNLSQLKSTGQPQGQTGRKRPRNERDLEESAFDNDQGFTSHGHASSNLPRPKRRQTSRLGGK